MPTGYDAPFVLVFTDLDGTLLDHDTYDWKPAKPALNRMNAYGFPIIPVSSKTRAEIQVLRRQIPFYGPFITENGGGLFFSESDFKVIPPNAFHVPGTQALLGISLGTPYGRLVEVLKKIREESGVDLKGFSEMTHEEIIHHTDLDPKLVRAAVQRDFDEPFLIMEKTLPNENALIKAAQKRGLSITKGGRFYHLHGDNDKGRAMALVTECYRETRKHILTVALGDSPNDFPMLARADYPVLIKSKQTYPILKQEIPHLIHTAEPGPLGWNQAVMKILDALKEGMLHE